MIPFFKSISEFTLIINSRDKRNKNSKLDIYDNSKQINYFQKSNIESENHKVIKLPLVRKVTRYKWIRSKRNLSKIFNSLDYNYQIQPSYDLTLIERQSNYDKQDVA